MSYLPQNKRTRTQVEVYSGNIRQALVSDIPAILDLGKAAYGFDNPIRGRAFLEAIMEDKRALVMIGSHSFGIAYVYPLFYWQKPRGHILQVASIPKGLSREALRLMQALIAWLKNQGCFEVTFGSEIGTDYASFARLLGASPQAPSYVIRFDKEPKYA